MLSLAYTALFLVFLGPAIIFLTLFTNQDKNVVFGGLGCIIAGKLIAFSLFIATFFIKDRREERRTLVDGEEKSSGLIQDDTDMEEERSTFQKRCLGCGLIIFLVMMGTVFALGEDSECTGKLSCRQAYPGYSSYCRLDSVFFCCQ